MRVYFAADLATLRDLDGGGGYTGARVVAASDDELDEFAAMTEAAAGSGVVVAAEIDQPESPVTMEAVAALHVDTDGTGDLAWYAPQELDQVIDLLTT